MTKRICIAIPCTFTKCPQPAEITPDRIANVLTDAIETPAMLKQSLSRSRQTPKIEREKKKTKERKKEKKIPRSRGHVEKKKPRLARFGVVVEGNANSTAVVAAVLTNNLAGGEFPQASIVVTGDSHQVG